jgi:octaprenyl-diphosphate synthase
LELNEIYAPINGDLALVNNALSSVSKVDFAWLSKMLDHSLRGGGKRIRPALNLLCGKFYHYDLEHLLPMAMAIELMHTATLVHDDAIDKSMVRRGRETINKLFGLEQSVLLGDYLFARAGVAVADTQSIRAIRLFSKTLMIISSGEINQAVNSYNLHQSREQYIGRILGKTASLFALSTESGGILAQAPEASIEALKQYGTNLGIAFQIVDDILDFIGTEEELGKPAGSDLGQGTFTLPAMLLNEQFPEDNPVKRLFHDHNKTENIQLAIEQVRNSSIVEECYHVATGYCSIACRSLDVLPDNPIRHNLMELTEYVVKRKR